MGLGVSSEVSEGLPPPQHDLAALAARCASQPRSCSRARSPSREESPSDADHLLAGCPRELAEVLRDTGQWEVLRCRPWLSAGALRGLLRSLQHCGLRQLAERYREAGVQEECTFATPTVIPWNEVDLDHVVSAGQIFRLEDADHSKVLQLRRAGLQVLRQGKVAVVLLAGGANLRLGGAEPPIGCNRKLLQLRSGKSILQLCCERIRRVAQLCCGLERAPGDAGEEGKPLLPRPSIPVFVMTSRLTHRSVVEHFEANAYFGLPPRDIFLFEQAMYPVLDEQGRLLPQSLGGEFAQVPGGAGQVLSALVGSSAVEQMRDRGVECLHIVGTENVLARVCDPVFIGFARDLELDCACKIVERSDPYEDLELFCVRQSPVSTQFADIEEAASGLSPAEAPDGILHARNTSGSLTYGGFINAVYMSLAYVDEVVGRRQRSHKAARIVPYLDFHLGRLEPEAEDSEATQPVALPSAKKPFQAAGVAPGSWPPETPSPDLACQRALMVAAAEVRAQRRAAAGDREAPWRCDVHLDGTGPLAVVRVRSAVRSTAVLERSLCGPQGAELAASAMSIPQLLHCSLVVPSKPNAVVLESCLLDHFAYSERAVALQVAREREYAPVQQFKGTHCAEVARKALSALHCGWVLSAGARIDHAGDMEAPLEVSPLLSYDGEGLGPSTWGRGVDLDGSVLRLPLHLTGPGEVDETRGPDSPTRSLAFPAEDAADGLDTRPFYLQEYPQRPEISRSHVPRFKGGPGGGPGVWCAPDDGERPVVHPSSMWLLGHLRPVCMVFLLPS